MKRTRALFLAAILIATVAPAAVFGQGGPGQAVFGWLRDNMAMEMGSVTIGDTSYSKVVLSPELKLGRLKLGLYLPVIYKSNMFDPSDWYKPAGNNEWDFGTAYWGDDTLAAVKDTVADLVLKIKYIEFGQQLEDPFFFKMGNLKELTIGHGLILRDYRNDTDFPAVRRTGVNMGVDFDKAGFEALASDLPAPEIVGARLYVRPIPNFKLAIGLSAVADFAAAKDLKGTTWDAAAGNMWFMGGGLDLDLPIIASNEILSVRAFADAAVTLPYFRETFAKVGSGTQDIEPGLQTQLFLDNGPENWGAAAGFMGNVLFLDWRLEYRYFNGIFRPAFFDSTYERRRSDYALQYIRYLDGTSSASGFPTIMGVYGEAGFSLFKEKLSLKAGYMWPWTPADGLTLSADTEDEFHAGLQIRKGLIPVVDAAGSIYYDKWGLVGSLMDGTFAPFDSKTAFAGEVEIPIPGTPNLAIGAIFKIVAQRDPDTGAVVYNDPADPSKGIKMQPSVTLETRFRF